MWLAEGLLSDPTPRYPTDAALKALAEPHRRAILTLVADEARPVGDIADHLDITPQAVSRHLKVLHEAGLVDERREVTRHLFAVNPDGFVAVQEFLAGFWAEHLDRLRTTLTEPRAEPGRQRHPAAPGPRLHYVFT